MSEDRVDNVRVFLRSSVLILFVSNITNLFSFLIQAFLGRSLSPTDYGTYNATLSMGMVMGSLVNVIPIVMSKSVSEHIKKPWLLSFINHFKFYVFFISIIFLTLFTSMGFFFHERLQFNSSWPLVIYGVILAFSFPITFYSGVLNGFLKYIPSNLCMSVQALMRLVFSILFVMILDMATIGALLAIVIADAIALCFLYLVYKKTKGEHCLQIEKVEKGPIKKALSFSLPVALNWVLLSALMYIDVFFVKYYVDAETAGYYSGVSVLGRIAYFLPAMIIAVLLPHLVRDSKNARAIVFLSIALTFMSSFGFATFVYLFGEWPIKIMYGESFLVVLNEFTVITFAMAFIAVIVTMTNTLLARNNYYFLFFHALILILSYISLDLVENPTAMNVVEYVLLASVLMFFCDLIFIVYDFWNEKFKQNKARI